MTTALQQKLQRAFELHEQHHELRRRTAAKLREAKDADREVRELLEAQRRRDLMNRRRVA